MSKQNNDAKHNWITIIRNFLIAEILVLLCIISVECLLLPFLNVKLNWSFNVTAVANIVMPTFLVFVTIWFTGTCIYKQIYINKFPEFLIQEIYEPVSKTVLATVVITIMIGIVSIGAENKPMQLLFSISAIILTFLMCFNLFESNNNYGLKGFTKNCISGMIEKLKSNFESNNEEFNRALSQLNNIYAESISHKEYYVCLTIHEELSRLFVAQLKEANHYLLSSCIDTEEDRAKVVKEGCRRISSSLISQIIEIDDMDPARFRQSILRTSLDNMNKCLTCERYSAFNSYLSSFEKAIIQMNPTTQNKLIKQCFSVISALIVNAYEKDSKEPFDKCCTFFEGHTFTTQFYSGESQVNNTIEALAYSFVACLKKDIEVDSFSIDLKELFNLFLSCSSMKAKSTSTFNDISNTHIMVFLAILDKKETDDLLIQYIDFLKETFRFLHHDYIWLNCIYLFSDLLIKNNKENVYAKLDSLKLDILLILLKSNEKPVSIMLPRYLAILEKDNISNDEVNSVSKGFSSIINCGIRNAEPDAVYTFCSELTECILSFGKSDRSFQESLLNNYFESVSYAAYLEELPCYELCLNSLNECIRALDKESKISKNLAEFIIKESFALLDGNSSNSNECIDSLTTFLLNLMKEQEEVRFLLQPDIFQYYCNKWLELGVSFLENNNEFGVRQVSHALGWIIINSLKRNSLNDAKIALTAAEKLNNYSKNFTLDESSRLFLLTLFVIVGSYCCTNAAFFNIRDTIIKYLMSYDYKKIKMAFNLRFISNDTWDELFAGKSREMSSRFLAKLNKEIQDKRVKDLK